MNQEALIRDLWAQMDDLQFMVQDLAAMDDESWLAAVDQMMGYGDEN